MENMRFEDAFTGDNLTGESRETNIEKVETNLNVESGNLENPPMPQTPVYPQLRPYKPPQTPRLAQTMQDNYGFFGGICLLYGLLVTFCLYRNLYGITFPILVGITIGASFLMLKKVGLTIKKDTIMYVAGMVILGIDMACTTSGFLLFFNLVGIWLLFVIAMLHQFRQDKRWDFPAYVIELTVVCFRTIGKVFSPFVDGFRYLAGAREGKRKNFIAIAGGIALAVVLLIVVFPMLMSSDMVFESIFINLLKNIKFETIFLIAFLFLMGFVGSYAFFLALCSDRKAAANRLRHTTGEGDAENKEGSIEQEEYEETVMRNRANPLVGISCASVMTAVYLLYVGIQVIYLFLRTGAALPDGMTYSEYARHGFNELLFVSIINFILVVTCLHIFKENKALDVLLTVISACTFVMIASALYRMMLYVGAYHLTFLRVLVLWFFLILTLIMGGTVVSIYKKRFPLFRYVAVIVGCGYIAFALAKPDRLVASYNIDHMDKVSLQDMYYLTESLSDDATPVIAKKLTKDKLINWEDIKDSLNEDGYDEQGYYYEVPEKLLHTYYLGVCDRHEKLTFRTWNLARYQAREAAKKMLKKNKN